MSELNIPPNPDYGKGLFIRALDIRSPHPNHVLLGMEDMGHAFQIALEHDGRVVTAVNARWHRHPLTTCPGAPDALRAVVGCPLSDNVFAPQHFTDSMQQCTHMFDMLRFGIIHAWYRRPDCRYEAVIPDMPTGPQSGRLFCNGELLMEIAVEGELIQSPLHWRGVQITRGFGSWAAANLSPEERERVFFLQRAFFMAKGRRRDYSVGDNLPAAWSNMPQGVCFASQPSRYPEALRLSSSKDHSDHPEEVLRFFPLA